MATHQDSPHARSSAIRSWLDLEARYRQLAKSLPHLRLDIQSGVAGEHFNLTGEARDGAYRQFCSIAAISGRMLERALKKDAQLLKEPDPLLRWFRFVQAHSPAHVTELPGQAFDDEGKKLGMIYLGRVHSFAEESANMCLELEASHPIRDDAPILRRIYNDYGRELIIGAILAIITAIVGLFFG